MQTAAKRINVKNTIHKKKNGAPKATMNLTHDSSLERPAAVDVLIAQLVAFDHMPPASPSPVRPPRPAHQALQEDAL